MKFTQTLVLLCCLSIFLLASACETDTTTNSAETEETTNATEPPETAEYAMVIHGGAGTLRRADMTADKDSMYRLALDSALTIG